MSLLTAPVTSTAPLAVDLEVDGALDAAAVLRLRRDVVASQVDGPAIVLVDVTGVDRVTASGIAGLLELLRIARSAGGELRVVGESAGLATARAALQLTTVVAVYRGRAHALAGIA
ncbi:STAS domain-containing protein [Schumannella sp. 10F1B-5-1]|uniref:STAS domain-containing protein n=1 Tax=Schumannella sp. 10F1B-5-1 TaxID=2590780 RepID=UPI0015E86B45|nr:STAS domain-containing protein [Schumannella sp. 10F1B-5-1]